MRVENLRKGGFLITKIHQLTGRILTKKLKEYQVDEINPAQGRLIFFLWKNDNISIQELAEMASLSKSTLTSMLDRLEESGYIQRVPCQADRRKILLQLTPKADEIKKVYVEVVQEMGQLYYGDFTQKEADQCEEYLNRIFMSLSKYEEEH